MKHTLTADNADVMNVGKGVDPGQSVEDAGFYAEGDSVEALELSDGTRLVLTGVTPDGVVTGVVFEAPESDETETDVLDETPVEIVDGDAPVEPSPNVG